MLVYFVKLNVSIRSLRGDVPHPSFESIAEKYILGLWPRVFPHWLNARPQARVFA